MATESFEMDCCIKIKSPTFRQEIAGIVSLPGRYVTGSYYLVHRERYSHHWQ